MGDEYDNGLSGKYPEVRSCEEAESRWILLGFEDPDIAHLQRSVPTPATEDVPMALQLLASIGAKAFIINDYIEFFLETAPKFWRNLKYYLKYETNYYFFTFSLSLLGTAL